MGFLIAGLQVFKCIRFSIYILLQDPWEFMATGEEKFTLSPRACPARVLGKTAECTRSDDMVGLGIVQSIQKTSCAYSDAQCNTNLPQASVPTLAACDGLRAKSDH